MASGVFTPYSTVAGMFGQKPTWIPDELDIARIQSYQTYEQIYWNVPDIFQISLRGSNELPIYVPSGRTIIDATNRFVCPSFSVTTVDQVTGAATPDSTEAMLALTNLMRRERFRSKFKGAKRYSLIQGDWIWHLTGDLTKPEGSRLSLVSLDPGMYFPILDDNDVDKIIGVHLVEQYTNNDGEPKIRRLTYRKVPRPDGLNSISVEEGIFAIDKWAGPTDLPEAVIRPVTLLDPRITQIPVYHIKNFDEPGNPFGSSELRGLERLMAGINQTMSDEDLTLAMEGIGVYATDGSQPMDPVTKKPTPWRLGPGRVVHSDGTFFHRITGASALNDSYGAHYDRLWEAIKQAGATPDVAIGKVDVSVAQSGVALRLQLAPMLGKAEDKTDLIIDVHTQMFYDIVNMWMPAYEGLTYDGVMVNLAVGDAIPVDRVQRFAELDTMLAGGVIDTEYYREEVKKLGYVFPDGIGARAKAEFDARNTVDLTGARLGEESDDDEPGTS